MSDEILILLSQYINGDLSQARREALEARIQQEPELTEALNELLIGEQAIQAKGDSLLKARMDQRGKELFQAPSSRRRQLWPFIAAAAAVALLLGLYIFKPFSKGPQWQEMAEAFPIPHPPVAVRGSSDLPKLRQSGSEFYAKLQNQQAIGQWVKYLNDTTDTEIQFYLGIAYWQVGQMDSAQYFLSQVPQASSFYERASWYQSALCVEKKDKECLKTQLNSISKQNGHYKQASARAWLEALE
ncbi:MAG: hypothetical protein AAF927_01495 [Bacteroidota bacterium]